MQVLKVKLYQEIAVYRNPVTMEVIESFPLPPPSTMIGLTYSLIGEEEYFRDINVSIQGEYGALLRDYQHYKKYGMDRPYPIVVHILHDVNLILHIYVKEPNKMEKIKQAFESPPYYAYLGRAEDLIKIEDVKMVEVKTIVEDSYEIQHSAYIAADFVKKVNGFNGVPYRLPTFHEFLPIQIRKEICEVRNFDWCDYYFVEAFSYFETDEDEPVKLLIDDDVVDNGKGDVIWWCMPNQNL